MPMGRRDGLGCKCPACLASETARDKRLPAYRTEPGGALTVLHLLLHASLLLAGMALIGRSCLALMPLPFFHGTRRRRRAAMVRRTG